MNKLLLNSILIVAGISLISLIAESDDPPEVQAQASPWVFSEGDCQCGAVCPCKDTVATTEPASAPLTKLVWQQDCTSGNSCSFIQVRVPYGDSRPEVGSSQTYSNQRVGLFRRVFGRR